MPIGPWSPNCRPHPGPFDDTGPSTSPFERDWVRMYLALQEIGTEQALRRINDLECGSRSIRATVNKVLDYDASQGRKL